MFCFILDNTIMLCKEYLMSYRGVAQIQHNIDVVLCQLFMIASNSQ